MQKLRINMTEIKLFTEDNDDIISIKLAQYKQIHKMITVYLLKDYYDITKIRENEKSNFSLKIIKNCVGDADEFNAPYYSKLKEIETKYRIQVYDCISNNNISIKSILEDMVKELNSAINILLFEPIKKALNNKNNKKYANALYELYRKDSIFNHKYTYTYSNFSNTEKQMRLSFSIHPIDKEKFKEYMKKNNVIENVFIPIFNIHVKNHADAKLQSIVLLNNYVVVTFKV